MSLNTSFLATIIIPIPLASWRWWFSCSRLVAYGNSAFPWARRWFFHGCGESFKAILGAGWVTGPFTRLEGWCVWPDLVKKTQGYGLKGVYWLFFFLCDTIFRCFLSKDVFLAMRYLDVAGVFLRFQRCFHRELAGGLVTSPLNKRPEQHKTIISFWDRGPIGYCSLYRIYFHTATCLEHRIFPKQGRFRRWIFPLWQGFP